jgi:hypothetical protein
MELKEEEEEEQQQESLRGLGFEMMLFYRIQYTQ